MIYEYNYHVATYQMINDQKVTDQTRKQPIITDQISPRT